MRVSKRRDDDYIITLSGRPCSICGQPRDWHDDEPPYGVPADEDEDGPGDPGCPGYKEKK